MRAAKAGCGSSCQTHSGIAPLRGESGVDIHIHEHFILRYRHGGYRIHKALEYAALRHGNSFESMNLDKS